MSTNSTPLWKQFLGAAVGSGLALLAYSGYTYITPALMAHFSAPENLAITSESDPVRISDTDLSEEQQARIVARAKEIQAEFLREDAAPAVRFVQRDPSPVSDQVSDRSSSATTEATHVGAPTLPSSGIGLWLSVAIALAMGIVFQRRASRMPFLRGQRRR